MRSTKPSSSMTADLTEAYATLTFDQYKQDLIDQGTKSPHYPMQTTGMSLDVIQKQTHPGLAPDDFSRSFQGSDNPVINKFRYQQETNFNSAFASMVHTAFAQHKALELRPDDLHLLILQGITNFVQKYPEDYRKCFIDFDGKETVKVTVPTNDPFNSPEYWDLVPIKFADVIRRLIHSKDTADLLLQNYSQTSKIDRIVKAITLMGTFSSYLNYEVHTRCHIPQFVLQGTIEDWKMLGELPRQLITQLNLHDVNSGEKENGLNLLYRWLTRLQPVLDNMHQSRIGNVDPAFWQSFYKSNEVSGGDKITGHVVFFYPFLIHVTKQGEEKVLNPFIMGKDITLAAPNSGPTAAQLPANFVNVEFKLIHEDKSYDMGMKAGMVAHTENPNTHRLLTHFDFTIFRNRQKAPDEKADLNIKSKPLDSICLVDLT